MPLADCVAAIAADISHKIVLFSHPINVLQNLAREQVLMEIKYSGNYLADSVCQSVFSLFVVVINVI